MKALALALAAVVLLGGCGGGGTRLSHDAYAHELRTIVRPLAATLLRPELANAGRAAITRRVDAVQRALRRAASRLDALRPPKDAAAANRQAVEGMREFAQSLDAVRAAAAGGTAEQLREAKAESSRSPGATKMNRALGELRDAGYRIG